MPDGPNGYPGLTELFVMGAWRCPMDNTHNLFGVSQATGLLFVEPPVLR